VWQLGATPPHYLVYADGFYVSVLLLVGQPPEGEVGPTLDDITQQLLHGED
jgi:hypothetical protein